jgi:choline dehydrogenase-like flavoprotein
MIEEIRVRGISNLHPVGTCRTRREVDAVVDPRLRVYGVEGCVSPTPFTEPIDLAR